MRSRILLAALVVLTLPSCHPSGETARTPVHLGPEIRRLAEEYLALHHEPFTLELTLGGEGQSRAEEAEALLGLIREISPGATVVKRDFSTRPDSKRLGVNHGPVLEMKGRAPGVLRYYGFPERKEIRPFLDGILTATGRTTSIPHDVESYMKDLSDEVLIRIFTTPD
ncbi:MAG: hypothetical protein PVJ01_07355 [Pseudomonadota bacterium]|jgi:hypothetical protein